MKATSLALLLSISAALRVGATPPPNDDFANRILIESVPAAVAGTTVDATFEPNEPQAPYQMATVWYEWVAPTTGILRVRVTDCTNAMVGTAFCGSSLENLKNIGVVFSVREMNIDVQQGLTYQFRVAADQPTPWPLLDCPFVLRLEYNPPPPNDYFTNRIRLSNAVEKISFRNVAATLESWESALAYGGRTVWYQWQPPTNGVAR